RGPSRSPSTSRTRKGSCGAELRARKSFTHAEEGQGLGRPHAQRQGETRALPELPGRQACPGAGGQGRRPRGPGAGARGGGGRATRGRASRVLAQNFLADGHALELGVNAAAPEGLVLEPGAGEGVLTEALAEAGARVVGYEIDPRLAGRLRSRLRDDPRIEVVRGDFAAARPPGEPFAVAGNTPYSATPRIVGRCLRPRS